MPSTFMLPLSHEIYQSLSFVALSTNKTWGIKMENEEEECTISPINHYTPNKKMIFLKIKNILAQSAVAVEYTHSISADR